MPRKTDRHRKRSDLTVPAESLPGETKERKSSEQVQDVKASFGVRRVYFLLGVFLICVAVFIPFYLHFESSIPVTIVAVASQPPQPSECAVNWFEQRDSQTLQRDMLSRCWYFCYSE